VKKLISIIIPNYNKGSFLSETLQSILDQTYENWEAIVIDDGSTDNSLHICKNFTKQDRRFLLIQRKRQPKGATTCRNIGIENAKGKYILFLDSDDIITPTCLENRLRYLKQDPNLDFGVFPTGTFIKKIGDSTSKWLTKDNRDHLKLFLRHDLPWNISSVLWEKNFLLQLDGFRESYPRLQDVELHTRALIKTNNYRVFEDAQIDFYYRISPGRSKKIYDEEGLNKYFLTAVTLYLKDMLLKLETLTINSKKAYSNALLGSYFAAVNKVLTSSYRLKTASKTKTEILLVNFHYNNSYMLRKKPLGKLFIHLYTYLFKNGFWRIKGFNRLSKFLFTNTYYFSRQIKKW